MADGSPWFVIIAIFNPGAILWYIIGRVQGRRETLKKIVEDSKTDEK